MSDREIVLCIQAVLSQRIDMVYVELALVQHEIKLLVADEAVP